MLRVTSRQFVSRMLPRVARPASCGTVVLARHLSSPTPTEETTFNMMVEDFALRGSELVIDKIVREEKKMPKEEKRAQLKVVSTRLHRVRGTPQCARFTCCVSC